MADPVRPNAQTFDHLIRRRVNVDLAGQGNDPFSGELDRRWSEQLNNGRLFLNEQFLTIVIRPPRGKADRMSCKETFGSLWYQLTWLGSFEL